MPSLRDEIAAFAYQDDVLKEIKYNGYLLNLQRETVKHVIEDILAIIDEHASRPVDTSAVASEKSPEAGHKPSEERPARDVRLYSNLSIAFMSVSEALMRCSTVFDALTAAAKEDSKNAEPN